MKKIQSINEFESIFKNEDIPEENINPQDILNNIKHRKNRLKVKYTSIIATSLLVLMLPMMISKGFSYAEVINNITESILGKVISYIEDKNDGGFQLIEREVSDEQKIIDDAMTEFHNNNHIGEAFYETLETGEIGIGVYRFQDKYPLVIMGKSDKIYSKEDDFFKDYDIAFPDYIIPGYRFDRVEVSYTVDLSKNQDRVKSLEKQLKKDENLIELFEKVDNKKPYMALMYFEPGGTEEKPLETINSIKPGYSTIMVEIRLDENHLDFAMVSEDKDYTVEKLDLEVREVIKYSRSSEDIINSYVFKVQDRDIKTYRLMTVKENTVNHMEIENMIKSFK